MAKKGGTPEVHTLLVQVGRAAGDGLPDGATGAGLLCFAAGRSEDEAVRETVAVIRTAGLAPIEVTAYGTERERRAEGYEIGPEEEGLMTRALEENAVVIAEITPLFDDETES